MIPRRFFQDGKMGHKVIEIAIFIAVFVNVGFTGVIAAVAFLNSWKAGDFVASFFAFFATVFVATFLFGLVKNQVMG